MNADPFSQPALWDAITINGLTWGGPLGSGVLDPTQPMFCKIVIEGASRFYKVDQKDGQGLDGATQTYRGVKPKPFKLKFIWYTSAQHAYWSLYSSMFFYTASKANAIPPVFDVGHPALALLAIYAVLVDEVGQVEMGRLTESGAMWAQSVVTVRQFYPPPPLAATITPVGAPPVPPVPGAPAPTTASSILQAQIAVNASIANSGLPGALPF